MDPFTICTTAAGLIKTCGLAVTTITTCSGLVGKYKNAPQILASIRAECTSIKTALSHVDWLVKRDTDLLSSQLKAHSPLAETLDVALTGCAVTFSLLDIELRKLYDKSKDPDGYKWKDKMRYVWNEDRAKNILDQMRGLQSAISLVLTALQTSSISALAPLLRDQKPVIERVRQDTRSTRKSLSLQLDLTADADMQASSKDYSIFNSSIGDEEFSFDNEIISSFAYRKAIKRLASKAKATQHSAKPDERHILDKPLMPTFTVSQSQQISERQADDDSLSWNSINPSANKEDTNGDVSKLVEQRVRDNTYRQARPFRKFPREPLRVLVEPSRRFHQGRSTTAAAVSGFDNYDVPPMPVLSELHSSDIRQDSLSSEQTETSSPPGKEGQRAGSVVQQNFQSVTQRSPHAVSPSPRKPVGVSGMLDTNDSNVSSYTPVGVRNGSRRDPARKHLRSLLVEFYHTDSQVHTKVEVFTDKNTYNKEKASRQTERLHDLRRDSFAKEFSSPSLTAVALKQPERENSFYIHNEEPRMPELGYRRRRVNDNRQDSKHDAPLLFRSTPSKERLLAHKAMEKLAGKPRDVGAEKHQRSSKTRSRSVSNNSLTGDVKPRLLETVENAISHSIKPELETLEQKQEMQQSRQKFDRDNRGSVDSGRSVSGTDLSRKLFKKGISDMSEKSKMFLDRDEHNADILLSGDLIKDRKDDRYFDSPSERRLERDMSEETVVRDGEKHSRKRSKEHRSRDATAEAIAGGMLTAAALHYHDLEYKSSFDRKKQRRRRRRRYPSLDHGGIRDCEARVGEEAFEENHR